MSHPNNNTTTTTSQPQQEEEMITEEVEVFFTAAHDSSRPIVLPSRASMRLTNAQRRWRMLQNMVRFRGYCNQGSSLTNQEHEFLRDFDDDDSSQEAEEHQVNENDKKSSYSSLPSSRRSSSCSLHDYDDDEHTASSRRALESSIASRRSQLSPTEASFLSSLARSKGTSPHELQQSIKILELDPLYATMSITADDEISNLQDSLVTEHHLHDSLVTEQEDEDFEDEEEKKQEDEEEKKQQEEDNKIEKEEKVVTSSNITDDPFRSELWTYVKPTPEEEAKQVDIVPKKKKKKTRAARVKSYMYKYVFGAKRRATKREEASSAASSQCDGEEPPIVFSILGTSILTPSHTPHVLNPPLMDALRPHLPLVVQQDNFWLKYSMQRGDGANLLSLHHCVRRSARTLLAIETMEGHVFGAFCSSPWRHSPTSYFGSGEAFVWKLRGNRKQNPGMTLEERVGLETDLEVYHWTGDNRNVQRLVLPNSSAKFSDAVLTVGGGGPDSNPCIENSGGPAITIESHLTSGFCDACPYTFGNKEPLIPSSCDGMFEVANLEVWTMSPVHDMEQAEQLELGRQFIFDHGNFVQQ